MIPLKDLLEEIKQRNLIQVNQEKIIEEEWQILVQNNKSHLCKFDTHERKAFIEVENHLILCDLQLQSTSLLKKLNEKLSEKGLEKIKTIKFKLGITVKN